MYHTYPYNAQIPIVINGEYETRTFTSKDDIDAIIRLLIEEVKEENNKGSNFNIAESIIKQLPFFACTNSLWDKQAQKDISRYVYSESFKTPPYLGSYGDQPAKWVEKSFLIKNIIERKKIKAISHGGK